MTTTPTTVTLDGVDLTKHCTHLLISHDPHGTTAEITIQVIAADVDIQPTSITITDAQGPVLVLGWPDKETDQ